MPGRSLFLMLSFFSLMHLFALSRPPKGHTALPCLMKDVPHVLHAHGVKVVPLEPLGVEVIGVDTTAPLPPALVGALEMQMAHAGLLLFRGQGTPQNESGTQGTYLTGEQQLVFSEAFGQGELHSTHGVHPKSPNRHVFRLSNDPSEGFNQVSCLVGATCPVLCVLLHSSPLRR